MSVFTDDPIDIQQLVMEQGVRIGVRARLGSTGGALYGSIPAGSADPHSTTGIARCPVCWNATVQRPASSECTICFGTGWTGGFAAEQYCNAVITTGTITVQFQDAGQFAQVTGIWCLLNPADAILLPGDLLRVSGQTPLYVVGEEMPYPGWVQQPLLRRVQLLPQAVDSPWQQVPLA